MPIAPWFRLVKFSHSIFALPFALMGAWLAAGGLPETRAMALIVLCAVAARSAAMGFNRLVDRRIDALSPRTQGREILAGVLSAASVALMVVLSSTIFVAGAFALNSLSGWLSLPVLFVLLFYSLVKRFSWLAHAVLGLALGLAPLGAWMAIRGNFDGDLVQPLALAAAVLSWVMGFDLIYSCQDVDFDQRQHLHSIPARFGVARALTLSSVLHVVTLLLLLLVGWRAELGWVFHGVLGLALVLLVWQHRIVRPDDLSRVDMAFFSLNGWVSVALFVGTVLDVGLGRNL